MEIFLLGNGFDLYHSFPTKYANFLHVVQFLTESFDRKYETVGSILSDNRLHKIDNYIERCSLKHYDSYHSTYFSCCQIEKLIDKGKTNIWFKYLLNSFNKDLGWIDFEKEIVRVIDAFNYFFESIGKVIRNLEDEKAIYLVKQFSFFSTTKVEYFDDSAFWDVDEVKKEYQIENPIGSGMYEIDKDKIINELYEMLRELAEMLKLYLLIFVDEPAKNMKEHNRIPQTNIYLKAKRIFTLNYTNTYEYLYGYTDAVEHIHGNITNDIVLGVNPNTSDELGDLDTSFIQFKKYYQRIFLKTDETYLQALSHIYSMGRYDNGITLNVVGHSLDITDEDIITELFALSKIINIYYHNENAVGSYIKNLVSIYGKSKFDEIRISKNIKFIPHDNIEWNDFYE